MPQPMSKLNIIDFKHGSKTKTYAFALLIFNESFFANNIEVFEDLNSN